MQAVSLMCLIFCTLQSAYEQALEVFELVEDADKVSKVLINLSNMCEMQVSRNGTCVCVCVCGSC